MLRNTTDAAASSSKFHGGFRQENSGCSDTTPEMHAATVSSYGTELALTASRKLVALLITTRKTTIPVTVAEC